MEAFVKAYDVDEVLGEGGFGTVYRCRAKMNGRAYAAKRIDPSKIKNAEDEEKVKAEIKICGMLCHQHVVRLRRCFSDDDNSHMLVFELLEGGELFDLIASWDTYSERDARHCIRQVLLALAYLETKRIVHRDLKPENLMLVKPPRNGNIQDVAIKLVDFGIAKMIPDGQSCICVDTSGSSYYLAPETLKELPLGCPVDVWAAGVVLYILLVGSMPFWLGEKGKGDMFLKIVNGEYSLEDPEWDTVSHQAKMLVTDMLTIDQEERITALEALAKPWINQLSVPPSNSRRGTLQRLKTFNAKRKLRGIVFALIAHRRLLRTPAFVRKHSGDSSSDGYVSDSSSESGILNEDDGKKRSPLPSTSSLLRRESDPKPSPLVRSSTSSSVVVDEVDGRGIEKGSRGPLASDTSGYGSYVDGEHVRLRSRVVSARDKAWKKANRKSIKDLVSELNL